MVHILGVQLSDRRPARIALTAIYGIGRSLASRILARLQIHESATLPSLTPQQMTSLTAFLSAPSSAVGRIERLRLAPVGIQKSPLESSVTQEPDDKVDPLKSLRIETDLRRFVRENIAHHKQVGTYIGRRHAMGLPVRGQRTTSNAKTARKLNRIERKR